jgi:imidazole glycerol-phosphate synthase subunit HisH
MNRVTIVDYGSGNLRSVQKACERLGAEATITSDANRVGEAAILILPGVGAFGDAMRELRSRSLVEPIQRHLAADKPFLGICMGLQLLFETGLEGGQHQGLAALPGDVVRFEIDPSLKVPHMGWNRVAWRNGGPLREDARNSSYFYFVHAYHARPAEPSDVCGTADYGGEFCVAVARGRLLATQFHPEKSQQAGLRVIDAFLQQHAH